MGRHSKPKTALQKLLSSQFAMMMQIITLGLLFGYTFAMAI